MPTDDYRWRRLWLAAAAVFVLAGATGALLRFGLIYGFPWELQWANVRHAHSHLMYFGWATPALMALIVAWLPQVSGRPITQPFRAVIGITIGLGLLAYVPFLLYGYRPAPLGDAELPLSVMAAGLNVLAWYGFAFIYWRQTRGAPRARALQLWDMAVLFLLLATLGAVGLPLMTFLNIQDPFWSLAFTHIFLDVFSEGWFVLAMLGLIYAHHPEAGRHPWARWGGDLLAMGLPVVFLLYMPLHLVPAPVRAVGGVGGLLVVLGTAANIRVLGTAVSPRWRLPLIFLGLKTATMLGLLLPPVARWATQSGLRVSYLHWLLLGFLTLGLAAAATRRWAIPGRRWLNTAVILLILSLIPLTTLWPAPLRGRWTLHFAAWAALGPVLVVIGMLVAAIARREGEQIPRSAPTPSS